MSRNASILLILLAIATLALVAYPALVVSQSVNPQLSMVIQDIRKAESAGAERGEMQRLIDQMNSVSQLQDQMQNLSPQDVEKRAQLLGEINSTLSSIDAEANQLETIAAQRTYVGHVIAYSSGVVGAVIGTVAYYYGVLLYRRYRIKRTFQMKIIPK
jgi:hypothetical protein